MFNFPGSYKTVMVKKKKKKSPGEGDVTTNGETSATSGSSCTSNDKTSQPKALTNQNVHPKFLEAQAKFSSVIKQSLENNEYLSSSEEEDLDSEALDNIMGKSCLTHLFTGSELSTYFSHRKLIKMS